MFKIPATLSRKSIIPPPPLYSVILFLNICQTRAVRQTETAFPPPLPPRLTWQARLEASQDQASGLRCPIDYFPNFPACVAIRTMYVHCTSGHGKKMLLFTFCMFYSSRSCIIYCDSFPDLGKEQKNQIKVEGSILSFNLSGSDWKKTLVAYYTAYKHECPSLLFFIQIAAPKKKEKKKRKTSTATLSRIFLWRFFFLFRSIAFPSSS